MDTWMNYIMRVMKAELKLSYGWVKDESRVSPLWDKAVPNFSQDWDKVTFLLCNNPSFHPHCKVAVTCCLVEKWRKTERSQGMGGIYRQSYLIETEL